jgi:hypothetical protein
MYLEYPDKEPAYMYMHQYMFGKELLVAPVTEPAPALKDVYSPLVLTEYMRPTSTEPAPALKDVYLPANEYWFDYFTGDIYKGEQTITYKCPLERMPLFVRAGSIIPMAANMDYSDQKPVDPLTLDIYAGKTAEFRLYEDDGISLDYRKGAYAWTPLVFKAVNSMGDYTVIIGPTQGKFTGQPKSRRYEIRLHGLLKPESVKVNGATLPERKPDGSGKGWTWDAKALITTLHLTKPTEINTKLTISIENVGTFADSFTLRQVLDFRERVRNAKLNMKLKHSKVVEVDINKPPRVIRETEKVERELNELQSNPKGIGQNPPDFNAMSSRILNALKEQPFESERTIPAADPIHRRAIEKIANAQFEPQEIQKITDILQK